MVQSIETRFPNRVADLFCDKTLLISGATGFLGKVLLEKLLRTCTSLKKIYVIVRAKKGKFINERLQEIFNGPLFQRVRQERGVSVLDKVEAISGDVSAPGLGLSPSDRRKLAEEVQIVYHSAASIRFDEPLKSAILLNVRGTKLMLELAEECENLAVFCYISTAYCHETERVLEDNAFYPSPGDPHHVIELAETLNEEVLNGMAHKIRKTSANNYTFTKALAEALVEELKDKLPVMIQRPTAVVPTWKEPIPGWTDNINGPVGLMIGAGKGVIRTMCVKDDAVMDCLPVDIIVNMLICSTYDYATYKCRRVYNATASREVEITIKQLIYTGKDIVTTKLPFNMGLWYPSGSTKRSRVLHYIDFVLFQLLPAIFLDAIFLLVGIKPFLWRVQKKIWKGYQVFDYYANTEWDFKHDNLLTMRGYLNPLEKKVFKLDAEGFDFYHYMTDCIMGARRYILKEGDNEKDIAAALKHMRMLWILDNVCKSLFFVGVFYYVYKYFLMS